MIAIKLWHVWQVIWLLGFKILTLVYLGPWLCDQAPDRKLCSVPPFLCKDRPIRIILHLLPWMSFLVIFPGLRQSPQPQICCRVSRSQPSHNVPQLSKSFLSVWNRERESGIPAVCTFYAIWAIGITESIVGASCHQHLAPPDKMSNDYFIHLDGNLEW